MNKTIAILCCGYFVVFIWLNVKQGIVATPVLQYGMFSGNKTQNDTTNTYVIYVNNKKIILSEYSFIERDILLTSFDDYLDSGKNNENIYNTFYGIVQRVHVNVGYTKDKLTTNCTDSIFKVWYKQKVEEITKTKINNIEIYKQKYNWQNNNIHLLDTAQKIFSIAN